MLKLLGIFGVTPDKKLNLSILNAFLCHHILDLHTFKTVRVLAHPVYNILQRQYCIVTEHNHSFSNQLPAVFLLSNDHTSSA